MTTRVKLRSAAAAFALIAATSVAHANDFLPESTFPSTDPFTLSDAGGSASAGVGAQNVTITGNNVGSSNVSAGGFSVLDGTDRFIAWCLDTMKTLALGTGYTLNNANPFSNGPSLTTQKKDDIKSLFNTAYDGFLATIAGGADATASAGFQLALWEIVNETEGTAYDITGGDFSASANATTITEANDYLTGLSDPTVGKGYNLIFLESTSDPAGQNLVTVSPVPLPAAGFLMLAGLGGLAASRKLRGRADA